MLLVPSLDGQVEFEAGETKNNSISGVGNSLGKGINEERSRHDWKLAMQKCILLLGKLSSAFTRSSKIHTKQIITC